MNSQSEIFTDVFWRIIFSGFDGLIIKSKDTDKNLHIKKT